MSYGKYFPAETIRNLKYEDKLSEMVIYLEKYPYSSDWRDVLEYILGKEKEPGQYSMLDLVLERMVNIDPTQIASLASYHTTSILRLVTNLRAFLRLTNTFRLYANR